MCTLQVWNALLERGAASEQRPRVARTPVPAAARARSGCHLADNVDAVVTLERVCSAYQVTATTTQREQKCYARAIALGVSGRLYA